MAGIEIRWIVGGCKGEVMASEMYTSTAIAKERCVQVLLRAGFSDCDWDAFEKYYRGQVGKDLIFWDLDLRQLTYVNSLMLGLLVGMNSELSRSGGQLRLVVAEGSMINQLLTISKIRKIVPVLAV